VVSAAFEDLEQLVAASSVLGYLNFSDGRPDPRWQRQVNEAWGWLARHGSSRPWDDLFDWLSTSLDSLAISGQAAFRNITQAREVLDLARRTLPAYRDWHRDLLPHLDDADLFGPFFLARVFEAVLAARSRDEATTEAILARLNDFVGQRPVAILESRPQGEPYAHEKTRPVPLYLRDPSLATKSNIDAMAAHGPYREVVLRALEILAGTDPGLLADAQLSLSVLEELAVDVRAYDHGHPANRRPNYVFGEWDPHHLDNQGRYCRYVVRKITLDALMDRVRNPGSLSPDEALFEGAAVLAGTILMGCGVSGMSPTSYDSTMTLTSLLPRIIKYRDAFYEQLLARLTGPHADRIRQEVTTTRQPFGAARQHLNAFLARHRAIQLQHRYLALLFAEMGYPEASTVEANRIPTASVRIQSNILGQLTSGQHETDLAGADQPTHAGADQSTSSRLAQAAARLPQIEDLLRRGIACGALPDPWNILGFQGLFPLSPAREDSIRDPRLEELLDVVEQLFNLYARLMSEAAASGQPDLARSLDGQLKRLAEWWDRFATTTVSDLRRVHGGEALSSARNVSKALVKWRTRGEGAADISFWREQLSGFRSPKAYALVVDALLRKSDYRAAMALATSWLEQAERVPLEDGSHSFHGLVLRWMLALTRVGESTEQPAESPLTQAQRRDLVVRLFGLIEANADDYWEVPALLNEAEAEHKDRDEPEEEEDLYGAAYEDVTYRDTTDDREGSVSDGGPEQPPYDLEEDADRLERRLRFQSTLARLWQIAARFLSAGPGAEDLAGADQSRTDAETYRQLLATLRDWLAAAREKQARLLALLDAIHAHPVPEPSGDYDSLVEYDRRRVVKEQMLYTTIGTGLDASLAVTALHGGCTVVAERLAGSDQSTHAGADQSRTGETLAGHAPSAADQSLTETREHRNSPPWETLAIQLERSLFRGDAAAVRDTLPRFLVQFREEPLLFTPLTEGGSPRQILRVRIAQTSLRGLLANLPRLGLLRETYELLRTARAMEQQRPPRGRGVTEFNHFFQTAYQAVVESLIDSSASWREEDLAGAGQSTTRDDALVRLLERLSAPFLALWIEHSRSLQLSVLEGVGSDSDWRATRAFIQRFGAELFHARFMTLGNLRGILHRGVGAYLEYLRDNADPLKPSSLLEELERGTLRRDDVIRRLELILQAVIENYEEYKDYNATTTQSDYGENLWVLLEFLRLKVAYDRNAWQFKPMVMAHEVLAKRGRASAARRWETALAQYTQDLARQHLEALERLERERSVRLGTVRDRLGERFLKPLALDRLAAQIEPAMAAARQGLHVRLAESAEGASHEQVGSGESNQVPPAPGPFARLLEELQPHVANPVGVGLDVPYWLRRLETEVHRVQAAQTTIASLAEHFFRVPRRPLSLDDLVRQLNEWQIPALPQ
jgi:hypothetical protein